MAKKSKNKKDIRRFQHLQKIQQQTSTAPKQNAISPNSDIVPAVGELKRESKEVETFSVFSDLRRVVFFFLFVSIVYGLVYYFLNYTNLIKF